MAFVLKTFGRLQLVDEDGNDVAFPEKGLLLLAYLFTTDQGSADRTTLVSFLWGDADRDDTLATLRKLISRIKARQRELGINILSSQGNMVTLDRGSLSSDILLSDTEEEVEPFSRLKQLVKLMDQPFLGPVHSHSRRFQRWLAEREICHIALLGNTLRTASRLAQSQKEIELLKKAAVILFRTEPKDPDTLQMLIEIFQAEEEVASLRTYFEQRRNAILRGIAARTRSGDGDGKSLGPTPASSQPKLAAAALEPQDIRIAIPRLVLLPPKNQSVRPQAGFLAASLVEDITIGFCAFNSLEVIAPYSAVQIGHHLETQKAFFERHRVNYILDTRISNTGDEVTLFAQLIFFDQNQIVWAERFSLDHMDLVKDRRTVARRIALSVSSEIERHEALREDLNPVAYHRYLVGRRHLARLTLPNLRRARKEMKAALGVSPDFAPALSSMARTYSKEWLLTARGDIELLQTAETLAKQATEARPDFADGYREFGVAKLLQGAFDESAEAMEVAESLAPHYADVIADYADTLVHCSLPAMALRKIERAIELNPLAPDTYFWTAAGANYALGDFEDSLDYIGQMADPSLADRLSAASWAMLGRQDKARVFVRRFREGNPDFDVDKWLSAVPSKEQWHKDLYREGLKKAGF
ncbi:membrane protein [Rhizobium leguminosarum]|uniref:membrane protein n=1 Tax=Rhizobium leguminosarum TaxID=384 RepID=UPI00048813A5|nr:membrane protein [Rhizobium leguminosarum]